MYMFLAHLIFNFSAPRLILFSQIRVDPSDSERNLSKSFLLKLSHEKGMQDWLLNFTKDKGMSQSNKPSTYVGGPLNH